VKMGRNKPAARKMRLAARSKVKTSPRWADIKKFGLKRARTRRIGATAKRWRRDKQKV
jgi:hypothetical protein